uniref:START domain-containing protein n=1 Tax=Odontella aurita TaxID=265563 RepID=A0A7S4N7E0_9STRA|mmetsp:Transcript_50376/g.151729  ORF Transcript_50376/g.151729 Transcript_50376/m.151729 type:complete len:355 (+) Transcript_50376:69-1133(+)
MTKEAKEDDKASRGAVCPSFSPKALLGASLVAAGAAVVALVLSPQWWAPGTSGHLIGESLIDSASDAVSYAERGIEEAFWLWDEPSSNWEVVHRSGGDDGDEALVVEARRITEGPFADSGVLLTRAEGALNVDTLLGSAGNGTQSLTADEVFAFITSPDGFAVIDPISDPEEFSKYVERYDGWKGHQRRGKGRKRGRGKPRLEVADAYVHLPPPLSERLFVVLNAIDPKTRVFVSKSVLHRDRPGSSVYFSESQEGENASVTDSDEEAKAEAVAHGPSHDGIERVRALNTFAVSVEEQVPSPKEAAGPRLLTVRIINFADVGLVHSSVSNWLSCVGFIPGIFDRLKLALSERSI